MSRSVPWIALVLSLGITLGGCRLFGSEEEESTASESTSCGSGLFASACPSPSPSPSASASTTASSASSTSSATASSTSVAAAAAPTVASISPSAGLASGGTAVTVAGTGFQSGATVTVGGASCTAVGVASASSLTCTTPAGTVGARDVVVTNPDAQSATLTSGFTFYSALSLSSTSVSLLTAQSATVTASGGYGTVSFTVASGAGSVSAAGIYTASSAGSDVVRGTDAHGNTASATITVGATLALSASPGVILESGTSVLTSSGGFGTRTLAIVSGTGTLSSTTGTVTLTAGPGLAQALVARATDSNGNTASATISAYAGVALGNKHGCLAKPTGGLKCWGENSSGQLGLGDTIVRGDGSGEMSSSLPTVSIGTGRSALRVYASGDVSCAIDDIGQLKCWGSGVHGASGTGTSSSKGDSAAETGDNVGTVNLGTGRTARALAGGYQGHHCVLLDDYRVKCWGYNDLGAQGYGDIEVRGTVSWTMGDNLPFVSLGTGKTAKAIAAGYSHSCAILNDDSLKCWGYNNAGQLGQGSVANLGDGASEMGDCLAAIDLGTGKTAKAVSGGTSHTCAILNTDEVKCWGDSAYGQLGKAGTADLGDGANEMGDNLTVVNIGVGRTARAIASSESANCVVTDAYKVRCWGYGGTFGTHGGGTTSHIGDAANEMGVNLLDVNLGANRLALGVYAQDSVEAFCALLDTGDIKCWGYNDKGQLGAGDTINRGDSAAEMGASLPALQL